MIFELKNKRKTYQYDTLASTSDKNAIASQLDGDVEVRLKGKKFGKVSMDGRIMTHERHLEYNISMIDIYLNIYDADVVEVVK